MKAAANGRTICHYELGRANEDDGGEPLMVQRPYYYVLDRMYNVFGLVDRAGAFVERYGYNGYGRPLIRESCGRGDFDQDTMLTSIDSDRLDEVYGATKWDPRADLDDDGDVDEVDYEMYTSDKYPLWSDDMSGPTVASAFRADRGHSDFLFRDQGTDYPR